jgi:hypothetical protein
VPSIDLKSMQIQFCSTADRDAVVGLVSIEYVMDSNSELVLYNEPASEARKCGLTSCWVAFAAVHGVSGEFSMR